MEWFSGNIPEAIQLAKRRGSVFIVYVTGEDDGTRKMDKMWADGEVSQLIKQNAAVAIKIKSGSEECSFFSQIYPVVLIPTAYFIGNNGMPLEVLGEGVELDDFKQKVKAVLEAKDSGETMPQQNQQQVSAEPPAASVASGSSDMTAGAAAASEDAEPDAKKAKTDINERVERAKSMIETKRIQKAKEEEEKEKQKEIERRKMGQNVQQLKQFQQERELMEVREQLKKEKDEERKARERVKQQIERDRAERNAKYQKEKAEKEEKLEEARKAKLLEQQRARAAAEAQRSETVRLQFRLPDGSSVANQFPSADTLQTAYDFISQRFGGSVTLSTAYPRRVFTQDDMNSSFRDLQLAPSAVLIVVPARSSLGSSSGGGGGLLGSLLSVLFAPLTMLWNFLMSFFSTRPAVAQNSNSSASSSTSVTGGDRARPSGATTRSRQEGNVRRLRNADDDDDENATWNGNSTQQM